MNVLITGANGFVGQHLAKTLAARGHAVIAATRIPVSPLPGATRMLAAGELDAGTNWRECVRHCEAVVHLAARAHRGEPTDPVARAEFTRINVEGSARLLDAALAAGVRRFVLLSSSKVYGETGARDEAGEPLAFTARTPLAPVGPYGETKLQAETLWLRESARAGASLTILRPPLIYGPGQKGNLLALMRAIAGGWPLPLAAVRNRRSFLYVGNLCEAIALALARAPAGVQRAYPLSDCELSTPELIRALAAGLGRPARLWPLPVTLLRLTGRLLGRQAAVSRLCDSLLVGNTEFSRDLDWQPTTGLEAAMRLTGDWFRAAP